MSIIDEYIEATASPQKEELLRLQRIIESTVPEAEKVIDYGMPAYKYRGKYLIGFHVFRNHMSLFPTSKPIEALRSRLGDFKISKGTIRFTPDNVIPETVVRKLILHQIDSIDRQLDK